MENINLQERLNTEVYHPLTTLKNYAVYLKKFAVFVKANEYVIGLWFLSVILMIKLWHSPSRI